MVGRWPIIKYHLHLFTKIVISLVAWMLGELQEDQGCQKSESLELLEHVSFFLPSWERVKRQARATKTELQITAWQLRPSFLFPPSLAHCRRRHELSNLIGMRIPLFRAGISSPKGERFIEVCEQFRSGLRLLALRLYSNYISAKRLCENDMKNVWSLSCRRAERARECNFFTSYSHKLGLSFSPALYMTGSQVAWMLRCRQSHAGPHFSYRVVRKNSCMFELSRHLTAHWQRQPMHSPSALTEHMSLNLARFFLLDPVHILV